MKFQGVKCIKTFLLGQIGRNDSLSSTINRLFDMELVVIFADKVARDRGGLFPYELMTLECEYVLVKHYEKFEFKLVETVDNELDGLYLMIRKI